MPWASGSCSSGTEKYKGNAAGLRGNEGWQSEDTPEDSSLFVGDWIPSFSWHCSCFLWVFLPFLIILILPISLEGKYISEFMATTIIILCELTINSTGYLPCCCEENINRLPDLMGILRGENLTDQDRWWLLQWQCGWGDHTAQTLLC